MAAGLGESLRGACHPGCFVCAPGRRSGLRMAFAREGDGAVSCAFVFGGEWEGYPGLVHGGIVAAALDGAMTNWLLAHGHAGVTAELKVRYRHPVATGKVSEITARLVETSGPVFVLAAELRQDGRRAATAGGKFIVNASSDRITGVRP